MDGMDYWHLCDEVTVAQAALLLRDTDPAKVKVPANIHDAQELPEGFEAVFAALTHAIVSRRLKASVRHSARLAGTISDFREIEYEEVDGVSMANEKVVYSANPDWNLTTMTVEELKKWLRGRGVNSGFFFPNATDAADYLDPRNPHYSAKLAAAISAWEHVNRTPMAQRGKTVKQAIMIWLRLNAGRFGLAKEDGTPNEQGIEEVSKIANWDTKGGAPKTPGA